MAETQRDIAEYQTDHDLLIRLDEKLNNLIEKVTPLADDHETRLRKAEGQLASLSTLVKVWGSIALAVLGLGEVLLQVLYH